MTTTDGVLIFLIACALLYALYDQWIVPRRKGETKLAVPLKSRSRVDFLILAGLTGIVLVKHLLTPEPAMRTTFLLVAALLLLLWLGLLRVPWLRLKTDGFFLQSLYVPYSRIEAMNLTRDGALVVQLPGTRLVITVRHPQDLEKIYRCLVELP